MANFNRVLLMGRLTRDPELKYTTSGRAVGNFGLAVSHIWNGPDGNRREETTFVDCDVWGKQAETFCEYMSKGQPVFVEGRLRLDSWQTQDGQKRSKLRVVCERFQFLGGRGEGPGRGAGPSDEPGARPRRSEPPEPPEPPKPPKPPVSDEPVADDDVPF